MRRMEESEEGCEGDGISDAGESAVEGDKLDSGEHIDAEDEDEGCRFVDREGGCLDADDTNEE